VVSLKGHASRPGDTYPQQGPHSAHSPLLTREETQASPEKANSPQASTSELRPFRQFRGESPRNILFGQLITVLPKSSSHRRPATSCRESGTQEAGRMYQPTVSLSWGILARYTILRIN
jgi:hypothetical protein